MKWDAMEKKIRQMIGFAPHGFMYGYSRPYEIGDLNELLTEFAEDEKELERLEERNIPPSETRFWCDGWKAREIVSERWNTRPLVEFGWAGLVSWNASLDVVELEDYDLLCYYNDERPYFLCAGVAKEPRRGGVLRGGAGAPAPLHRGDAD